jgi:hypothetical protein
MFHLFIFASVVFLVAGAYLRLRAPGQGRGLVVREPDRLLTGLVSGKTYEIDFQVHNPTGETKRVFGGSFLT